MKQNPWELIASIKTLSISSINDNNTAHSSYAPFIENEHKFYVCISGMAKHTKNLFNNESVSCLIIEDESKSTNLFARKRVTLDMQVNPIERNSLIFNGALNIPPEFSLKSLYILPYFITSIILKHTPNNSY